LTGKTTEKPETGSLHITPEQQDVTDERSKKSKEELTIPGSKPREEK